MSNNRNNDRRPNQPASTPGIPDPDLNKFPRQDETIPPFEAFKAAETENTNQLLAAEAHDEGRMEDRDGRGDPVEDGKIKPMIPIHEVDALADEWAAGFAREIVRVTSEADDSTLTVTVTTRHGTSKASAKVDNWTAAGVKKALAAIREKYEGKVDASADNPDKALADAVRQAVKA